jgi:predicted HicB family RNase H-like nuclease
MEGKLTGKPTRAGFMVRLPQELKTFLADQAAFNSSSQNSEIIRAVRERMDRVKKEMPASAGK